MAEGYRAQVAEALFVRLTVWPPVSYQWAMG